MTRPPGPVVEVVHAIAEAEGVEPHELEYRLHDHVDTEALRGLVEGNYEDWALRFRVPGHHVCVRGGDAVYVDDERVRPIGNGRVTWIE